MMSDPVIDMVVTSTHNLVLRLKIRKLLFTPVKPCFKIGVTLMILSFRTNRSGQTVQSQIRLLLEEQSDQGLNCLLFHLHLFDKIHFCWASLFEF